MDAPTARPASWPDPVTSVAVGVWAESSKLLDTVHGVPILRLTLRRARRTGWPTVAIIPWTVDLDHLAAEVRSWRVPLRRTHTDRRIAMRDLVAHQTPASYGVLVEGAAANVDLSELYLAVARLKNGHTEYITPRMTAYHGPRWLQVSDTDEWAPIMGRDDLEGLYGMQATEDGLLEEARMLMARRSQPTE